MTTMQIYGQDPAQYVVLREGGEAPTIVHDKRWIASKEARRLSGKHPGIVFHVAKIKESFISEAVKPARSEEFQNRFRQQVMGNGQ